MRMTNSLHTIEYSTDVKMSTVVCSCYDQEKE